MKLNHLPVFSLGIISAAVLLTTLHVIGAIPFARVPGSDTQDGSDTATGSESLKHQLETFRTLLAVTEPVTGEASPGPEEAPPAEIERRIPGNIAATTLADGRPATYDRLTGEITGWDTYSPEEAKRFGFDFDFRRSDYATYSLETLEALADGDDYIAMMYVAEVRARERDYDEAKRLWLTSATISGQTRGLANGAAHFFGRRNFYAAYIFGSLGARLGDDYTGDYAASAANLLNADEIRAAAAETERIFRAMEEDRRIRTGHGF